MEGVTGVGSVMVLSSLLMYEVCLRAHADRLEARDKAIDRVLVVVVVVVGPTCVITAEITLDTRVIVRGLVLLMLWLGVLLVTLVLA